MGDEEGGGGKVEHLQLRGNKQREHQQQIRTEAEAKKKHTRHKLETTGAP